MVCLRDDPCSWLKKVSAEVIKELPLTKRYSQHVMVDCKLGYLFRENLSRLNVRSAVEIGAGPGLLTKFIKDSVNYLIAVELDIKFLKFGSRLISEEPNVEYLMSDGLKLLDSKVLRVDAVVSNTPYSLTGPLLASIVKSNIPYALLTLQKEVGERLVAEPGSRSYGRATVFVQNFMKPEIIDYVSPTSFYPPPKVWSTLLLLRRYRVWREEDETLEKLIKCLFNQRRKKALKIVKECVDKLSPRRLEESELRNLIGEKRVYELSASTINAIHELITSK
ncbi:MAG: 16S rRNA (adenine(1518)-N(6)/adenine(1519)-N(6))-dimethyltransferase RsmA [Desulfurococcaceae archaeon]|nr:16S rRNA (adenine(1518)-N(6)/adenine(1519)-N(6))-dimethyltransferase RsmA [Desulfurococcaceae archaeon]